MNSFQNAIVYRQEEQHFKRVKRAKDFFAKAQEKMNQEGSYTVTMELEDTSDSFYRLLGDMDVTRGLFVVTRPWFGLCKSKVRVVCTVSVGGHLPLVQPKISATDSVFKY